MHAFEPRQREDLSGLSLCCRMDARRAVVFHLNNRQGQLHKKSGAHTFALTCGPYRAAVQIHKLLANRQTQPEATEGLACRAVFLREAVEDVRKITCWNANAGVADAQF